MGNQHRNTGSPDRSRAVLMRDAALARVGRTRRWVIAGAAALTAGIAALVSAVAPGRSLASKTTSGSAASSETASASGAGVASSSGSSRSSIPAMPPPASAGDLGLQSPDSAPSPDNQSQPQSAPSQPQSAPSQPQSQPAPQPQPVPAPAPPSSGVVSGGS